MHELKARVAIGIVLLAIYFFRGAAAAIVFGLGIFGGVLLVAAWKLDGDEQKRLKPKP